MTLTQAVALGALQGGAEVLPVSPSGHLLLALGGGFTGALLTGLPAVKALQWLVARRKLLPFAIYRACLGVGAIALG